MKKIVYIVNVDWFFVSHRLPIALAASNCGYSVYLLSSDSGEFYSLRNKGIKAIDIPINRSGTGILSEFIYAVRLILAIRKIKPDLIHNSTLKPVIYGSIAGVLFGKPVINAISGLGFNLNESNRGLKKSVMIGLMRLALKHKLNYFIFQNEDDRMALMDLEIINKAPTFLIKGVGVDLLDFNYSDFLIKEKLIILLPARMLFDKGILEFIEASIILKDKWFGKVEWILAGKQDRDNPACLSEIDLRNLEIPDYLTWIGHQNNIKEWLIQSDIVVLPSYREGMPKSLIEACAIGRPIVTTEAIGCRECVDQGINGYKVPVKDPKALADAIDKLLSSEELRNIMGAASRKKAEKEFDVNAVIKEHLYIYNKIVSNYE